MKHPSSCQCHKIGLITVNILVNLSKRGPSIMCSKMSPHGTAWICLQMTNFCLLRCTVDVVMFALFTHAICFCSGGNTKCNSYLDLLTGFLFSGTSWEQISHYLACQYAKVFFFSPNYSPISRSLPNVII